MTEPLAWLSNGSYLRPTKDIGHSFPSMTADNAPACRRAAGRGAGAVTYGTPCARPFPHDARTAIGATGSEMVQMNLSRPTSCSRVGARHLQLNSGHP